jgi:hypothetical protein
MSFHPESCRHFGLPAGKEALRLNCIAVVHQSLLNLRASVRSRIGERFHVSSDRMWLVKNFLEHPSDPGWEDGTYCLCHLTFRNRADKGLLVADTVNVRGDHRVRSAFYVREKRACPVWRGTDLLFDKYYFTKGEPFSVTVRFTRATANYGQALNGDELLSALTNEVRYGSYEIGTKPDILSQEAWDEMSTRASMSRFRRTRRQLPVANRREAVCG